MLDRAAVEFVDSSGLSAILHGKSLCEHHPVRRTRLRPHNGPVERMFDMTGVKGRLRFRPLLAWHDLFAPLT